MAATNKLRVHKIGLVKQEVQFKSGVSNFCAWPASGMQHKRDNCEIKEMRQWPIFERLPLA